MRKKSWITKRIVAVLVLAMTAGLFTGCGNKAVTGRAIMDKDHVYCAEYYKLPEGMNDINTMKIVKDRIYLGGYSSSNGVYQIYSMNADGSHIKLVYEQRSEENASVNSFAVDQEGNVCFYKTVDEGDKSGQENVKDGNKAFLVKVSADGNEILNRELKGKDKFEQYSVLVDGDGRIFVLGSESVDIYDKSGKQINFIDTINFNIDRAFLTQDGNIMIIQYNWASGTQEVTQSQYDAGKKQFSEPIKMPDNMDCDNLYQSAGEYDLFMKDSTDLYGYNVVSGEKTKLINWIDSDIYGSSINNIGSLSDGTVVCVTNNYIENINELAVLSKVDPKDVLDKTVLTMGTIYAEQVSPVIIEFNKKSDKYHITLKDYSSYYTIQEEPMSALQRLDVDITSGNVPDIICLNDASALETYTSKGFFVDLYELMDKDENFNRKDYLENIFQALESDGKLYKVAPKFSIGTVVGKTSNVGNEMGWTIDDLEALIELQPKETKIFDNYLKSIVLHNGIYMCMNEYIDWEKGICSFDNSEFKRLLEFADQFPDEESMRDDMAQTDANMGINKDYRTGKTLLMTSSYISSFAEFHRLQKAVFGEDVTFIGFPTASRNGSAFSTDMQFSISSKCVAADTAWSFVKTFLEDDYQEDYSFNHPWPIKLSAIEKMRQKDQKVQTYMVKGKEKKLGAVTDEECEKVMTFIKSLNQVMRYDAEVYKVVIKETGAYFAGQKSADETTKSIQESVQTYLSEIYE